MHLLLDTHAFLWFINGDESLNRRSRLLIQEADNDILISIATLWEIAIKNSLNKLELSQPFEVLIPRELSNFEIQQTIRSIYGYYQVVPIDEETIIEASIIRSTHQLSYWDSLVVVSAITSKCAILYSEDMQHNQIIQGVKILNPFSELPLLDTNKIRTLPKTIRPREKRGQAQLMGRFSRPVRLTFGCKRPNAAVRFLSNLQAQSHAALVTSAKLLAEWLKISQWRNDHAISGNCENDS